jgi:hypothetical protein
MGRERDFTKRLDMIEHPHGKERGLLICIRKIDEGETMEEFEARARAEGAMLRIRLRTQQEWDAITRRWQADAQI